MAITTFSDSLLDRSTACWAVKKHRVFSQLMTIIYLSEPLD